MSEKAEQTLQPADFSPQHVVIHPTYFRQLIEGLRALPNVSDLAVIKTITELDRIAGHYEHAERSRALIFAAGIKLAERWIVEGKLQADVLEVMKRTGAMPSSIMMQVMDDVCGETPVHPTCDCPRCTSKRDRASSEGGTATLQ